MEDKLKYIVGFQLVLLVLLSIGALIEILQKPVTCDPCPAPVMSAWYVDMWTRRERERERERPRKRLLRTFLFDLLRVLLSSCCDVM